MIIFERMCPKQEHDYTHTHIHTYTYTRDSLCGQKNFTCSPCFNRCMHSHTYINIHIHAYSNTQSTYIIYTHHTYIALSADIIHMRLRHTCMNKFTHPYMHTYIHTYTRTHTYIHVYLNMHTYITFSADGVNSHMHK